MKLTYSNASAAAKSAIEGLQPIAKAKAMPAYLAIYGPYRSAILSARKRGVSPEQIVMALEKHGVRSPLMARMHLRGHRITARATFGACIMIGKLCNHKG